CLWIGPIPYCLVIPTSGSIRSESIIYESDSLKYSHYCNCCRYCCSLFCQYTYLFYCNHRVDMDDVWSFMEFVGRLYWSDFLWSCYVPWNRGLYLDDHS